MSRYTHREGEADQETQTDLTVTRSGDGVLIQLARTAKGRTTEISLNLGDEERRDLGKLLG